MKAAPFVLIGIISATVSFAQQAPVRDQPILATTGTAIVRGVVVANDAARTPLRRALVTLSRVGLEDIRPAATDDQGQFVFTALPAGTYSLGATKGGFIGMSAGAIKPGMPGRQIVLRDAETAEIAPIALTRGAVIAGRVVDAAGRPVGSAQVTASRVATINGERRPRVNSSWSATTNDHGDYRIFGLFPGEYVVAAWQGGITWQSDITAQEIDAAQRPAAGGAVQVPVPVSRPFALAPTLYPSTVDETTATPIQLASGDERLGVDIVLQRVPVATVTGVLVGMDGKPLGGLSVDRASRKSQAFLPAYGTTARTAADGSFALTGVPPGDYVLRARGADAMQAARTAELAGRGLSTGTAVTVNQWAAADVTVNGTDVGGVSLRMQPGISVSGQLAFPNSAALDVSRVRIQVVPVERGEFIRSAGATPDAQNGFRIEGLLPGRYRLGISGIPTPFSAQSAMLGDADLLDFPLDVRPGGDASGVVIALTNARTELGGRLTAANGQPAAHLYVLAFSQNRAHWAANSRRILSARAGEDGSYALAGLPPGDYFLCALTEIDTTLQYEPTYLEELVPASIKLSLSDGEKKVQHLRAGG